MFSPNEKSKSSIYDNGKHVLIDLSEVRAIIEKGNGYGYDMEVVTKPEHPIFYSLSLILSLEVHSM